MDLDRPLIGPAQPIPRIVVVATSRGHYSAHRPLTTPSPSVRQLFCDDGGDGDGGDDDGGDDERVDDDGVDDDGGDDDC